MSLSILVCVKAVPDFSEGAALVPEGSWIAEEDLDWQMNPYDAHALEFALTLKEEFPDVRVDTISMGGEQVEAVIRRAMAMGADHGVHLHCGSLKISDPSEIASAIASYAEAKNYDLILTGAISADAMNGVTGPFLAAMLNLPCASAATDFIFHPEEKSLTLSCELEGGLSERIKLSCPALVTVQTGSRTPRYPSLSNTLRTRRQALEEIGMAPDTGHADQALPQECFFPEQASDCIILEGSVSEKADALLAMFHNNGWLK